MKIFSFNLAPFFLKNTLISLDQHWKVLQKLNAFWKVVNHVLDVCLQAAVRVSKDNVFNGIEALSNVAGVMWVEIRPRIKTHNKFSHGNTQSGVWSNEPSATPFWQAGVKGQGEIVGCGDTGIDVDSCFFW